MEILPTILPGIFLALIILYTGLFTVKQQTAVILERLGKFSGVKGPGLHLKIPIIDKVSGRINLKIQQLDVIVETKTLDDVFVKLKVSVQYKVLPEKIYDAFYKLEDPQEQITSYVFDTVIRWLTIYFPNIRLIKTPPTRHHHPQPPAQAICVQPKVISVLTVPRLPADAAWHHATPGRAHGALSFHQA